MKKIYRLATLATAALFATTMMATTPTETFRTTPNSEPSSRALIRQSQPEAQTRATNLNQDYDSYTWKDLGMAKYRENIVTSLVTILGYNYDFYEVPVQEAKEVPGLYRLVNPYGVYAPFTNYTEGDPENSNYDPSVTEYLYLHCENQTSPGYSGKVWMDKLDSQFHSTTPGYGNYHMSSYAYTYLMQQGATLDDAAAANRTGMLKDGVITFPIYGLVVALDGRSVQADGTPGWNLANTDGLFSVQLPNSVDYSIEVKPNYLCAKDNKITMSFFASEGIKVKYGLYQGRIELQDVDPYAIALETSGYTLPADQTSVEFTVPEGIHTFVAVTLDDSGEAQNVCIAKVFGINDDEGNWDSLGNTTWGEDFLPTFYSWLSPEELECELQIRRDGGMLRLVNPYKNQSLFNNKDYNDHPTDHNHYLYFNIKNPNRCEMPYSSVGFGLEGNSMMVSDYVDYWRINTGYSDDRIADDGLFGYLRTEADGSTWLRYDETCLSARLGGDNAIWRYCNGDLDNVGNVVREGKFGIKLPMDKIGEYVSGVQSIYDNAEGTVSYYNLQGQRVLNPAPGTIVIKKQGSEVSKFVVR